jgi:asparagine synthase (glutamine-hydrolysing)
MCGIAGLIDPRGAPEARMAAVSRMCGAMLHRGPDDDGISHHGDAVLGMRRLAIFDPANGHQPMVTADGRWTLVFNGAIYNFRELRGELAATGWEFRTQCDTEVLLAAFARWGERCVDRLRGMFAFAVWDDQEQALFLARDPFGIKPLYWRHDGSRFLFASELNALLASGSFSAEIDPLAVADYLAWFAVPAPRTIYPGVFSLRPGDCARFQRGRLEIRPTWSFRSIPDQPICTSRDEFVHELRARLEDTIRAHVLADVPVGAFLSGGLDSAAVVGLMTRVTGAKLRTFSIDFGENGYSEAAGAEQTARHFGATHSTRVLTGGEVARDLDQLLATLDQPTGDGVNTYYASQTAHEGGVKVALSGLGGDELFGGYPSFRDTPRLARWLPRWRRLPSSVRAGIIARLNRGYTRRRKLADFLEHATNIHEIGALQRRVFSETGRRALLTPEARAVLMGERPFHPELAELSAELSEAGTFEVVSAWELRTYMADVLLRDSDVMSMRHSLELRVPFVDRRLIEWLWRQPAEFKSEAQHAKSALSDAVADLLPPGLATRRKRGFTLPFAVWMRRELRPFLEATFEGENAACGGLLDQTAVRQLWRGYLDRNDTREWSRVWSLAILIAFANRRNRPTGETPRATEIQAEKPTTAIRAAARRTLLLAPEIFASEGGIPRILQTYLKALGEIDAPDHRIRLLALNDAPETPAALALAGGRAVESWQGCRRNKAQFVRAALRLSRGCDRIICGHIGQLPVAWIARRMNPRLRYYLIAHGIEVWRPFGVVERLALRGAEKIFCVSDYTRRELLQRCSNLDESRAVVLHNALDPRFEITGGQPLESCPPVILVVTRLTYADRYKGVQHMIEAMPAIRAAIPAARLRIIGRGDDVRRLTALRHELGLEAVVEFTGFVDDQRLAEEMRSCRLFALPSRKEGFGLVFLEAMAHGRPCLGARAGGIPEVITPATGMLVEYADVPGIAAATVAGLQRSWNEHDITKRADEFSFSRFKQRLGSLLAV